MERQEAESLMSRKVKLADDGTPYWFRENVVQTCKPGYEVAADDLAQAISRLKATEKTLRKQEAKADLDASKIREKKAKVLQEVEEAKVLLQGGGPGVRKLREQIALLEERLANI